MNGKCLLWELVCHEKTAKVWYTKNVLIIVPRKIYKRYLQIMQTFVHCVPIERNVALEKKKRENHQHFLLSLLDPARGCQHFGSGILKDVGSWRPYGLNEEWRSLREGW